MPRRTKADQFLELAKPDKETGFSEVVGIAELERNGLGFGNGGSWCRSDGPLAQKYNVERIKEKNRIVGVKLNGYNRVPISKPIPKSIREKFAQERCAVLHTSKPQTDHKDGRRDDPRLSDINKVTESDFQPLSTAANTAKRQHCKVCRETGLRFDARVLGYRKGQWVGDGRFMGTCVGCYWHDPMRFNQEATKSWK